MFDFFGPKEITILSQSRHVSEHINKKKLKGHFLVNLIKNVPNIILVFLLE